MARRLDDYEFAPGQGRSQYPWQDWLDGNVWELVRGEDFHVAPSSFRGAAQSAAARKNQRIHSRIQGDRVIIQAYTPGSS